LPSVVYVPDVEPGLALRAIAANATRIAVSTEDSRRFFRNQRRLLVSGYPVRPDLTGQDRSRARAALDLDPSAPTVLIFGGSKGARSINMALLQHLDAILDLAQVIHISGELDWPVVEARRGDLPAERSGRYHAYAYLHEEMPLALAAADLAISRAGASCLGEFPAVGLPAVLVPYPYAWRYQKVNAGYLASRDAAIVIDDQDLPRRLLPTVTSLLGDPQRLGAMRRAMSSLARPQAAAIIAAELQRLAEGER